MRASEVRSAQEQRDVAVRVGDRSLHCTLSFGQRVFSLGGVWLSPTEVHFTSCVLLGSAAYLFVDDLVLYYTG